MSKEHVMPQVISCEKKTFARNQAFDFASEMKKRNNELLVVVDNARTNSNDVLVVAYIVLAFSKVGSLVFLQKICVQSSYRGRGIGAQILEEAIERLRSRGCSKLQLWAEENNTPALRLYYKFGFEQVSMVHNYYGCGRNGLQMKLNIFGNRNV